MAFTKPARKKDKKNDKGDDASNPHNKILNILVIVSFVSFCIFLYCLFLLFRLMRQFKAQMRMEEEAPVQVIFKYILRQKKDMRNPNYFNYLNHLQNLTRNAVYRQDIIDFTLNSSVFPFFFEEIQRHSDNCIYAQDQNAISVFLETILSLLTLNEPKMINCDAKEYLQLLSTCHRSTKIVNLVFDCLISHIKLGCVDIPQMLIDNLNNISSLHEKDLIELREESLNFFAIFIQSQLYDIKYNQVICNYFNDLNEFSDVMTNEGQQKLSNLSELCVHDHQVEIEQTKEANEELKNKLGEEVNSLEKNSEETEKTNQIEDKEFAEL